MNDAWISTSKVVATRRPDAGAGQAGRPAGACRSWAASTSAMLDALRFGLPRRPELAHRLDKDIAGLPGAGAPSQGPGRR